MKKQRVCSETSSFISGGVPSDSEQGKLLVTVISPFCGSTYFNPSVNFPEDVGGDLSRGSADVIESTLREMAAESSSDALLNVTQHGNDCSVVHELFSPHPRDN